MTQAYVSAVNHSLMTLTDDEYFQKSYGGITHELIDNYELVTNDFTIINASYDYKAQLCMSPFPYLAAFVDLVSDKLVYILTIKEVSTAFNTLIAAWRKLA